MLRYLAGPGRKEEERSEGHMGAAFQTEGTRLGLVHGPEESS